MLPGPFLSNAEPTYRAPRRFPWFRAGVSLIVIAVAGWIVLNRPWEPKPLVVVTEVMAPAPASRVLAVNGRIEPILQVDVKSSVGGQIKDVAAEEGRVFKAGDILATLDDSQQRAAVAQSASALDAANAQLQQAKTNLDRAKSLGDSIARKDLDAAQLAFDTAQNDVSRLSAARDQALSLLGEYVIRAPFDGTVLSRGIDPGQVVDPSTVLFSFADLTHLRAEASIDELYSAEIVRGLKTSLQPSGYGRIMSGSVSFVSPTVDTSTGGRLVRVAIDDAGGLVLPVGLTVTLNITVDEQSAALTVPRSAILASDKGPAVFVIAGGRAVLKPIEYTDWPAARVIVSSGLVTGDVVITDARGVAAGALVSPKGA